MTDRAFAIYYVKLRDTQISDATTSIESFKVLKKKVVRRRCIDVINPVGDIIRPLAFEVNDTKQMSVLHLAVPNKVTAS